MDAATKVLAVLLAVAVVLGVLAVGLVSWAWVLMLVLGVTHAEFGWNRPVGFAPCLVLALVPMAVCSALRGRGR